MFDPENIPSMPEQQSMQQMPQQTGFVPDPIIQQKIQKVLNLQKMGRKIYLAHINEKVEESRKPKNMEGLEKMSKQFTDKFTAPLQKGGN